jgi:hypothetical protein
MCPEELANDSARVLVGSSRESEEVDKDMVEIDRLDAVQNLLSTKKKPESGETRKSLSRTFRLGILSQKERRMPTR